MIHAPHQFNADVVRFRRAVTTATAAYDAARQRARTEKRALAEATERQANLRSALSLCQQVAQTVQETAHHRIADVVTRSLAAVFDEPYLFRITFEQRRGKTEATLAFERDGLLVDPMTAAGGGVVDVAAFALRLSCLLLSRPPLRRVLIQDEPFRFVSAEYRSRVRELVQTLAREFGVQFVIVTHIEELQCGTVIRL